jgi:hypothetical protein
MGAMRQSFRHFFRPTKEEMNNLWQHGLFSFDASVLLNVYAYSKKTREEFVEFVEKNAARVRLAHQFGLEYARNRSTVIVKQVNNYLKVEDALRKIRENDIAPKYDHPYLSKKSTRAYQAILNELEESRKLIEKLIGSDPYAEKMFGAFEGRVSKCPTPEELLELEATAQKRYDKLVPPGFADLKDKDVPRAYGDCIAWLQLMEIASAEKKGVILVIDDEKEDWWLLERRRTLGPRPELLEEFGRITKQQFYMYNSENFLRAAKEFMSAEIRDDVIEEVSLRLASQRETERVTDLKSVPSGEAVKGEQKSSGASVDKVSDAKTTSMIDSDLGPEKLNRGTD